MHVPHDGVRRHARSVDEDDHADAVLEKGGELRTGVRLAAWQCLCRVFH